MSETARSLGLPDYTLWRWVRESRTPMGVKNAEPSTLSKDERAELKQLRKENAQQKTDMEIQKKAVAYFARETIR
jgi:transposase